MSQIAMSVYYREGVFKMGSVMEIVRIILPLAFVGAIAIFVVKRLVSKRKKGALGKKESKEAQTLLDSLIPLGMIFGGMIGLIFSMFFSLSLSSSLVLGAGIGLLIGYFGYESYSKEEESHS